MIDIPAPLRLRLDGDALVSNWHALDRMSGKAACGAAIKADGYGLGAEQVATRLSVAGCRDFFVATWREAAALAHLRLPVAVLHGVREEDMPAALSGIARPVLNTPAQVSRWKEAGGGACDVMVDTGMNRLGLSADNVRAGVLDGLTVDTLMSHLACADENSATNERQRASFVALAERSSARRMSLANSAGIALGSDYAFDLTRPGLALYGGVPRIEMTPVLRQVVFPEAEVLQRRRLHIGEAIGYNAVWTAATPTDVAILNVGYADGYARGFTNRGAASVGDAHLPVIGRVSMDLTALDVSAAPTVAEGDWITMEFALPSASEASGRSQYELLTSLSDRASRYWI